MGRRLKFPNGFSVLKIYLQPDEYSRFEKLCGDNMSEWARQILLAGTGGDATCHQTEALSQPSGVRKAAATTERSVSKTSGKTCVHGKAKGWNCGMCGGLAQVRE